MLEDVAQSPAMLYYLNNADNQAAGPNENFARELMEIHTLGAENYLGVRDPATVDGFDQRQSIGYVDNDVYEVARCFTGWRVNDNSTVRLFKFRRVKIGWQNRHKTLWRAGPLFVIIRASGTSP